MSQLRETLLEVQKEKTLRLLLGIRYDQATDQEKAHYLSVLGNQIEVDVDRLLNEYILSYQQNTPVRRKSKKLRWVYITGNTILGLAGAYAVNEKAWVFVGFIAVMMIINQYLPFVYNEE